jgi:predicted HicB family RNase H-like nuclease
MQIENHPGPISPEYQKSRLNIFLEPRLRHQLDGRAAEEGVSVTKLIAEILTAALTAELQTSN